jgi:hypothetical protein
MIVRPSESPRHHLHAAARSRAWSGNGDSHIAAERIQEAKQSVAGEAIQTSVQEGRDLGLRDAQELAGFRLR